VAARGREFAQVAQQGFALVREGSVPHRQSPLPQPIVETGDAKVDARRRLRHPDHDIRYLLP
jgi:hypothetical protein